MRVLLGVEHGHAEQHDGAAGAESTLLSVGWQLRVAGLFVVFAASMCSLITVWFSNRNTLVPRLLRSFSGGVITALALVHIVPEAMEQLEGLSTTFPVPVGSCAVLAGVMLVVILDSTLAGILSPEACREEVQDKPTSCFATESSALKSARHFHGSSSAAPLSAAAASMKSFRQGVSAVTMEVGCIFHSVIIGISVGVMTGDKRLVLMMITALSIHQGLEGLALGSVLAMTSFSTVKKVFMLFLYSITTPAGIAIGIAVASRYNPDSLASKAVQGAFNGVSGGMLLYIGLNQLLAQEFSQADLAVRPGLRFGMYLAMVLGASSMCALGIWA